MPLPRVYLCVKKGCGKKGERKVLATELAGVAEIVEVRCQSVCHGPVAGAVVAGRLQWFERVARPKARAGLVRLLRTGSIELGKPLARRRVAKRAGKLRT